MTTKDCYGRVTLRGGDGSKQDAVGIVDKLALKRAADEFGTGFHLHLAKHAVTVGADASRVSPAWIGNLR